MSVIIRVNLNDLLEKVQAMAEDDFSTVEINIDDTQIIEDSSMGLYAIDPVTGTTVDYGVVPYDDGEL